MSSNEQLVPVEQIDRDEAENYLSGPTSALKSEIRVGLADDNALVQLLARHRLAALRTPPADPVCWVGRHETMGIDWQQICDSREQAMEIRHDDHEVIPLYAGTPPAVEPDEGLVEKVAKAIYASAASLDKIEAQRLWSETSDGTKNNFRRHARAAIATLTPSIRAQALEEAAKAGWLACRKQVYALSEATLDDPVIDELIKGGGGEAAYSRGRRHEAKGFSRALMALGPESCDELRTAISALKGRQGV